MIGRRLVRQTISFVGMFLVAVVLFGLTGGMEAAPVPDIKINGMDGTVVLKQSDTMTISVGMDNGGETANSDWWFAIETPNGIFLLNAGGLNQNVAPLYQGPLLSFPGVNLLEFPVSAIPSGAYTFYFGVDTVGNGSLDLGSLAIDSATLLIATPTAKGTPTGPTTTQIIGPSGGTLSNGSITLNIPAGALSADTPISITSVTNTAHGGVGDSFSLGPDGMKFLQPVQISMTYSDSELNGSDPDDLGIFYQDRGGYWYWMGTPGVDFSAKTVTVASSHFTPASKGHRFVIWPSSGAVRVNRQAPFYVGDNAGTAKGTTTPEEEQLAPLPPNKADGVRTSWAAVKGGVDPRSSDGAGTTYIAPPQRPSPAEDTINATVYSKSNGRKLAAVNAKVQILPPPTWKGKAKSTHTVPGSFQREYTADVTFEYVTADLSPEGDLKEIYRVRDGTYTAHFLAYTLRAPNGAECTWLDKVADPIQIKPDDGYLWIYPHLNKFEAKGASGKDIMTTLRLCCKVQGQQVCTDGTQPVYYEWIVVKEQTSMEANGKSFRGKIPNNGAGVAFEWDFSEEIE